MYRCCPYCYLTKSCPFDKLQTWSLGKAVVEARCRDTPSVHGACLTFFKKDKVRNTGGMGTTLTMAIAASTTLGRDDQMQLLDARSRENKWIVKL